MKQTLMRGTVFALLACGTALSRLHAASAVDIVPAVPATSAVGVTKAANAIKYKTNLPPSAELAYAIKARQRGIPVDGSAVVRWNAAGKSFSVTNETRARLLGKILDARTEGLIDDYGLAPLSFNEKRLSKSPTATSFDRTSRTIHFSASDETYPLTGGEQDRNSIVWQLVAVARAAQGRFKPGSAWTFFVAGQRDAESWTFKVVKQERLRTPLGELNTVRITRLPPEEGKGQQLDIWLAPQRDWYPVRLRFSDDNGDYLDQTLQTVVKKAS